MRKCARGPRRDGSSTAVLEYPPGDEATREERLCGYRGLSPEQLLLAHLGFIKRLVGRICRRYHLRREEGEDLASWINLKLIDKSYRIIREYKGRSAFETYLTVVVQRLALDYFDHYWGKWRPSTTAKRLGALAIRIERSQRDGHSADERAILCAGTSAQPPCEFATIASRLSRRAPRRFEGEQRLSEMPAPDATPEELLDERERAAALGRAIAALNQALTELSPADQVIAKLRGSLKITAIAQLMGREQKPFYREMETILKRLRRALERQGVRVEELREALGTRWWPGTSA